MEYVLLIGGLIVLIIAGEALVRGAVAIALKFNLSPLVIGMTIVSFGTSAPELLVSLTAALDGHPEIAIGNVLGSNIANIALVLGLTTIILPITVKRTTVRLDWPIMMGATILFFLFAQNRKIDWWEGLIYTIGLIAFNFFQVWSSKKNEEEIDDLGDSQGMKIWKSIGMIIVGVVGLALGTEWLLGGAVKIAANFGVSEHIIGVTILAFGTSVPELITSIMAALKKQTDISVGNLIGSNIFNLFGVIGITSLVKEISISSIVLENDMYWLLAISFLLFPLMLMKNRIGRLKGAILFLTYLSYIYFVVS